MTTTSDLILWDLAGSSATATDLSVGSARVTGDTYSFADTDDILIDGTNWRVRLAATGARGTEITTYFRDPADDDDGGGVTWNQGPTVQARIASAVTENLSAVSVLSNTDREISLCVFLDSGNSFVVTALSGFPGIKVVTHQGMTNVGAHRFGAGGSQVRWAVGADGDVVRDYDINGSDASTADTTDNWFLAFDDDNNWVVAMLCDYQWDTLEADAAHFAAEIASPAPGDARSQWAMFCPSREAVSEGAVYFHLTKAAVAKDSTWSITFANTGTYRFAVAPTNTGGIDDLQLDLDATTFHTEGGAVAEDDYAVSRPVEISAGSHDIRVLVTDGDANASYELVWWPVSPVDTTEIDRFAAFPQLVTQSVLAARVLRTDIVAG